jgi:thioredoxin reductase
MAEYDVVVVGGGPAGLAATLYALQAQLRVALVAPGLGGKVSYSFQLRGLPAVESAWGTDLVQQFEAHIEAKLKAFFPQEAKHVAQYNGGGFQLTLADTSLIGARALIVCTGAQPQRLYVHGEKEFQGRGVSFSAISHARFFRGRNVAVVGGKRALAVVPKLAALANRVYFVVAQNSDLGRDEATPGFPLGPYARLTEKVLRNPKVYLFRDWEVQSISGDEFVTGLDLVAVNGETRTLAVEGVFVEFGLLPNNELVRDLVALDEDGHIVVNHRCETNVPGLFAAGDVTNVFSEQVPVAIGEGVKAALGAWSYLA